MHDPPSLGPNNCDSPNLSSAYSRGNCRFPILFLLIFQCLKLKMQGVPHSMLQAGAEVRPQCVNCSRRVSAILTDVWPRLRLQYANISLFSFTFAQAKIGPHMPRIVDLCPELSKQAKVWSNRRNYVFKPQIEVRKAF